MKDGEILAIDKVIDLIPKNKIVPIGDGLEI